MLSLRPALLVLLAAGLVSCVAPSVTVPFSGSVTVPGCDQTEPPCEPLTSLPQIEGISELDVRELPDFREAGETASRVETAELTALSMTIVSGAPDFSWLDRIELLAGGDGFPPVVVAELDLDAAARAGGKLALGPTGAALEEPLRAGRLLVTTRVEGRSPPVDTALRIDGALAISFGP